MSEDELPSVLFGDGLVLSLVRDLVQGHGGHATAHEREGGCEIRVEFLLS